MAIPNGQKSNDSKLKDNNTIPPQDLSCTSPELHLKSISYIFITWRRFFSSQFCYLIKNKNPSRTYIDLCIIDVVDNSNCSKKKC